MSEQLTYHAFDPRLLAELRSAVLAARASGGLAARLSALRYHPQPGDDAILSWHAVNPDMPFPNGLVVRIRNDPARWAQAVADLLVTTPVATVDDTLLDLARAETLGVLDVPPWVLLAYASPLYRSALAGEWRLIRKGMMPYDGPRALADALGGVLPLAEPIDVALDPADVARVRADLDRLDLTPLRREPPRELLALWENSFGGARDLDDAVAAAVVELQAIYAEADERRLGLVLRY